MQRETEDEELSRSPSVSASPQGGGRSRGGLMLTLLGVVFTTVAGALLWTLFLTDDREIAGPTLTSDRAEGVSRRIGVAFDDTVATWQRFFAESDGIRPPPPRLVMFSRGQPSPCSGAEPASGPFFCPVDRVAALDLEFLDMLEVRMRREAAAGTAIVVARVVAGYAQGILDVPDAASGAGSRRFLRDHSLQADCLTGVWAGLASTRLGTVPPGFYARLIARGTSVRDDPLRRGADPIQTLDLFANQDAAAREEAFRRGLNAANPAACPGPGPAPR